MCQQNRLHNIYKCDLHIHSCLSPCADLLMTPGNIIKRALKRGIDVIAIADHNTAGNVEAALSIAAKTDLIIIPAMEVESVEEVHLLCFFSEIKQLQQWENMVRGALPDRNNDEDFFGYQLLTDEDDQYRAKEERLLATATDLSVEEIVKNVLYLGGIVIPSHIDRLYNSIIGQLGFIPPELDISVVELSKNAAKDKFFAEHPELRKYSYIVSSDSHYLTDIRAWTELDLRNFKIGEFEIEQYALKGILLKTIGIIN